MNVQIINYTTQTTAVIQPMFDAIGYGWSFTILGLLCIVFAPALLVVQKNGMRWREERRLREENKK
jgi:hypothetical protein